MAAETFTILGTPTLVDVDAQMSADGIETVYVSASQTNTNPYKDSIILIAEMSDIVLNGGGHNKYHIGTHIQSSDGAGHWWNVGSSFEPLSNPAQGLKHVIIVQPNTVNVDEGVPIDVWDGGAVASRISRQQNILGDDFRVCMQVRLINAYGTVDQLMSFKVTLLGQRYDSNA